jgi:hypothetical protein
MQHSFHDDNRLMTLSAHNGITVEYGRVPNAGMSWAVRVFHKKLLFRRLVSSDWFLDEQQARRFAEALVIDLNGNGSLGSLRRRKPGWTLHRAPR